MERMNIYQTRRDVIHVVTLGKLYDDADDDVDSSEGMNKKIVEAEELPLGSKVIDALDGDAIFLEKHVKFLTQKQSKPGLRTWEKSIIINQRAKYIRRAARIRLYIATLLSARLKGKHGYESETIQKVLELDFRKAKYVQYRFIVIFIVVV